jgi:hypothetical protein
VAVLSAIRLRDTQTFGKQDPYVVLKCGGHADTFRTKVCRDGGTAPKWNERFTFALAGTEGNELNLRIWNKNTMTSDKCIGSATVKLDAVFKNETDDVDVEVLDPKGRASGVINLVLTFTPSATSNGAYVVQQQQQQPAYVVQQQQQQPAYVVQRQQQQPAYVVQQQQQQPAYVVQQQQQQPAYVVQQQQQPRGLIPQILTNGGQYMIGGVGDLGGRPQQFTQPAQQQQATPNVTYVQLPAYPVQQVVKAPKAPKAPQGYTPTPIGGSHGGQAAGVMPPPPGVMPPPPGWSSAPQTGGYAQYGDDDEWGV